MLRLARQNDFLKVIFVAVAIVSLSSSFDETFAQGDTPAAPAAFNADEERSRLINHLKTQVEPSLLERDLKRLRRDVMRLGSFRADWARESEKFLAENSALAELFLYDFSRIKNPRLNERILQTLLKFPSFQFPSAALAFESDLLVNPEGRSLFYQLVARILKTTPQAWAIYGNWILSQNDSSADYFNMGLSACRGGARFGGEARSQIEERLTLSPQDFWGRLVVEDLRACLRGS